MLASSVSNLFSKHMNLRVNLSPLFNMLDNDHLVYLLISTYHDHPQTPLAETAKGLEISLFFLSLKKNSKTENNCEKTFCISKIFLLCIPTFQQTHSMEEFQKISEFASLMVLVVLNKTAFVTLSGIFYHYVFETLKKSNYSSWTLKR